MKHCLNALLKAQRTSSTVLGARNAFGVPSQPCPVFVFGLQFLALEMSGISDCHGTLGEKFPFVECEEAALLLQNSRRSFVLCLYRYISFLPWLISFHQYTPHWSGIGSYHWGRGECVCIMEVRLVG